MPNLVTERIESVKAGIIGAGSFAIAELVIFLSRAFVLNILSEDSLNPATINLEGLIQIAIGAISGFLFGVTYRYIIRDDRNSHLNDGAVLAFGLVRGLALLEGNLDLSELLSLIILVIQSIICFAIARFILDIAISRHLIKLFKG